REAGGEAGAGAAVAEGAGPAAPPHAVLFGEEAGAMERPLAADHDQPLDGRTPQHPRRPGTTLRGAELLAARGPEDRPAALQDVGDSRPGERLQLAREQARVAAADADHLQLLTQGMAHPRAEGGVHPRCVAAA